MDFGKLNNVDRVDFSLPETPSRSIDMLAASGPREGAPLVHVGAPIWSPKQWVGRVYPKGTKSADFLAEYTKQFNSIELKDRKSVV